METVRKLSMNTSLKNARIFDDDVWEERDGREVKKIKIEPATENISGLGNIKTEPQDCDAESKIKIEAKDNDVKNKIKMEPQNNDLKNNILNDTLEEGELRDSFYSYKPAYESECKTPPSPWHIKPDPDSEVDDTFDESPYNKEIFNKLRIKEETPIKTEDDERNNDLRNTLKSAKRTVFNRHSPYRRIDNDAVCEIRMSAKGRLSPKMIDAECLSTELRQDIETDPSVIERRDKQIEYGKNTMGYDTYLSIVPREERKPDDPQTPNKYLRYSRRGWDGLIRQWRIKLHKYDPVDT